MSKPVSITRKTHLSHSLRKLASKESNPKLQTRLLVLALVKKGNSRQAIANFHNVSTQSIRKWVTRYNEEGVEVLSDRKRTGRPPILSEEEELVVCFWVEDYPNPEKDHVTRWRQKDLQRKVRDELGQSVSERTIGRLLKKYGYSKQKSRKHNPKWDPAAQRRFIERVPKHLRRILRQLPSGTQLELWVQDEMRAGQQGDMTAIMNFRSRFGRLTKRLQGI